MLGIQAGIPTLYLLLKQWYLMTMGSQSSNDENELENQSIDIPIWKRYLLSVTEAAQFYHIGEKRLRQIVDIHPNGEFYLLVGNKVLFKKEKFEQFLAESTAI